MANFIHVGLARPGERAEALAARGVMVARTAEGLRISVGAPADNERLLAALAEVLGPPG